MNRYSGSFLLLCAAGAFPAALPALASNTVPKIQQPGPPATQPPNTPATQPPAHHVVLSPRALVERAIRAHGGRRSLQVPWTRWTIEGEAVTLQPTQTRVAVRMQRKGDRVLLTVGAGPMQSRICAAGRTGWKESLGTVSTLSYGEAARMPGDEPRYPSLLLMVGTPGWKLAGLPLKVMPDGIPTDPVRITSPSGRRVDLYFAWATGRIAAVGYAAHNLQRGVQESYLDLKRDYRILNGVATSFRQITYEDGVCTSVFRMSRFDRTSPIPDSIFVRPRPLLLRTRSTEVPFDFGTGWVVVKASVNGGPLRQFMVDTGASISMLSAETAEGLGLRYNGAMTGSGAGGVITARLARVNSIRVGRATVRNMLVGVMDMGPTTMVFGSDFGGILGSNFLSKFLVTVDYGAHRLSLQSPRSRLPAGTAVPIDINHGIPMVGAGAGIHKFLMMLDTGSMITVLPPRLAPLMHLHSVVETAGMGVDGNPVRLNVVRLPWLTAAGATQQGAVVTFSAPSGLTGAIISDSAIGVLGSPFLRRFRVTLDYAGQRLVFAPTEEGESLIDDWTYPGVDLVASPPMLAARVFSIFKGSPAAHSGLQLGQPVVAIDGRPTDGMNILALNRSLRGALNSTVRLTVLADGERKTYILRRVRVL